jgi:hypothetical protein
VGPLSLEYTEIEAWCRLTRRNLDPWELRILLEMDVTYIQALNKKFKADEPVVTDTSIYADEGISSRPLTPALFDAIFAGNDNERGVA